ncbi:hypothetical protein PIROE2DRAFT_61597 [Piromyces sp. E2]|nr:hypothetical protein PIROE2DRAFT_61597 [Piromyces sp. E2]|eukprot:OUM62888.1 hypothetical protein PIROE2DRAFT_61597 [Piromyces sp. E2]
MRGGSIKEIMYDNLTPLDESINQSIKIAENLSTLSRDLDKSMLHYAMKRITRKGLKEIEVKEDSIAKLLMDKGVIDLNGSTINCLVNYKNLSIGCERLTQLMYHIIKKNEKTSKILIESPYININVTDKEGISAYGYAKTLKMENIVMMLENKFNIYNREGKYIKDFFGITSKEKVIAFSAGMVFAGLGFIFKKSDSGQMLYEFMEGHVIKFIKNVFNKNEKHNNKTNNNNIINNNNNEANDNNDINNNNNEINDNVINNPEL